MIPLHLRISGFLSYKEPTELDFTKFDLACVSGPNGAGKSTLLDAITWALFGQARRRDDSLVNLQSRAAEVTLTFESENTVYRVQRSLARGKTAVLEFQVRQADPALNSSPLYSQELSSLSAVWIPLTERTMRETQARLEHTLRLDYDTFINASFFLQGKADQFAQQSPTRRKEVLSNILGMETWESYKARVADLRRTLEMEHTSTMSRLGEIGVELGEEASRRQRLAELESQLDHLTAARKSQESAVQGLRKTQASLDKQRVLLGAVTDALEQSRQLLLGLENRLADRRTARLAHVQLTQRASSIESAYQEWATLLKQVQEWDKVASVFRDREKHRLPLLEQIAGEKARVEEEHRQLLSRQKEMEEHASNLQAFETELQAAKTLLSEADARLAERTRLNTQVVSTQGEIAILRAENEVLKIEMDNFRSRIDTLQTATGAVCPLCGQALSDKHRKLTLQSLQEDGTRHGNRFRANKAKAEALEIQARALEIQLNGLSSAEADMLARSASTARITERLQNLQALAREWESTGRPKLDQIQQTLERRDYARGHQDQLAKLDQELARLGYDAAAHDAARQAESQHRPADEEHRKLETAISALAPLDNEIASIEAEIASRQPEISRQAAEVQRAESALAAATAGLPDIHTAERALFELQEQENQLNQQVGAARQRVTVLDGLRLRKAELESARQSLALSIGRHKVLERAFGRDGVPALLIEQALPEIETRANEVLDRLSDGHLSVRFLTQAGYRDKKREDLKETLEIQISDGAGPRDYELYSGGEAFRVNFAIRLALSQVLAARKNARVQTLVIDEGFGSQDNQGRQRLVEVINIVKHDFAKILVITHVEELKDAFPTRIEVEKTDHGSSLTIT